MKASVSNNASKLDSQKWTRELKKCFFTEGRRLLKATNVSIKEKSLTTRTLTREPYELRFQFFDRSASLRCRIGYMKPQELARSNSPLFSRNKLLIMQTKFNNMSMGFILMGLSLQKCRKIHDYIH